MALSGWIGRLNWPDISRDPIQAGGGLIFMAEARHHLHADADAQKGFGIFFYRLQQGLIQTRFFHQGRFAGGKGAVTLARPAGPHGAARQDQR